MIRLHTQIHITFSYIKLRSRNYYLSNELIDKIVSDIYIATLDRFQGHRHYSNTVIAIRQFSTAKGDPLNFKYNFEILSQKESAIMKWLEL